MEFSSYTVQYASFIVVLTNFESRCPYSRQYKFREEFRTDTAMSVERFVYHSLMIGEGCCRSEVEPGWQLSPLVHALQLLDDKALLKNPRLQRTQR